MTRGMMAARACVGGSATTWVHRRAAHRAQHACGHWARRGWPCVSPGGWLSPRTDAHAMLGKRPTHKAEEAAAGQHAPASSSLRCFLTLGARLAGAQGCTGPMPHQPTTWAVPVSHPLLRPSPCSAHAHRWGQAPLKTTATTSPLAKTWCRRSQRIRKVLGPLQRGCLTVPRMLPKGENKTHGAAEPRTRHDLRRTPSKQDVRGCHAAKCAPPTTPPKRPAPATEQQWPPQRHGPHLPTSDRALC